MTEKVGEADKGGQRMKLEEEQPCLVVEARATWVSKGDTLVASGMERAAPQLSL